MSEENINIEQLMQDAELEEFRREYFRLRYVYSAGITTITSRLEALEDEFTYKGRHNPIHNVESRIKSLPSIIKKLDALGVPRSMAEAKKNLRDIAGVRVVCCYVDDIYQIYDSLMAMDDVKLVEKKDYIKNPKANGYRSLHIVVDLPVYLSEGKVYLPVEIQLRTVAMDFWASLEHEIRYKQPSLVPSYINEQLHECADIIASTDERMLEIFNEIKKLNAENEDK